MRAIETGHEAAYFKDERNPITFTQFLVRNPRSNGKSFLVIPSNVSSHNFIRPGSNILIEFDKKVIDRLPVKPNIAINAYLKRKDESVLAVKVGKYYDVNLNTNSSSFEKGIRAQPSGWVLNYDYSIKSNELPPLPVEISTANLNVQTRDKRIYMGQYRWGRDRLKNA